AADTIPPSAALPLASAPICSGMVALFRVTLRYSRAVFRGPESQSNAVHFAKLLFLLHLSKDCDSVTRFAWIRPRLSQRQLVPPFQTSCHSRPIPMNIVLFWRLTRFLVPPRSDRHPYNGETKRGREVGASPNCGREVSASTPSWCRVGK